MTGSIRPLGHFLVALLTTSAFSCGIAPKHETYETNHDKAAASAPSPEPAATGAGQAQLPVPAQTTTGPASAPPTTPYRASTDAGRDAVAINATANPLPTPKAVERAAVDPDLRAENTRAYRDDSALHIMANSLAAPRALAFARTAPEFNTEQYDSIEEEGFVAVGDRPLSTFSIDVDTASYSNVRRFLHSGMKPPSGAVRIEELINYFSYAYPEPTGAEPFSVTTEVAAAPWNPGHQLLMVGLRGRSFPTERVPARNLVFLIDVSGSMASGDKLPLVKRGLRELAGHLRSQDHVAIVVYAGAGGCVLEPTAGDRREAIETALDRLEAGGSTNGAEGIRLAYELARRHFDADGINRVILATDGDFNVGATSESELVELIERERESGVFLSVLGVGTGNLKDATMEQLADRGNGNYAYLDTPAEARKVLVEEASATLITIAKDVKIQIEFNPTHVSSYRLIGYENRRLQAKDFNDDKKDAGDIGAGHTVTALYEIVPADAASPASGVDPLRYRQPGEPTAAADSGELATVKLRYKEPDGASSKSSTLVVNGSEQAIESASADLRFAAAVATFGMVLRQSDERGTASYDLAQSLAGTALGNDPNAYRAEFLRLIALARPLG